MVNMKWAVAGLLGLGSLVYLISRAKAEELPEIDVTCPAPISVNQGGSANVPIQVRTNKNISKNLRITAGVYTETKPLSMTAGETRTESFVIPNMQQTTNYTVEVI